MSEKTVRSLNIARKTFMGLVKPKDESSEAEAIPEHELLKEKLETTIALNKDIMRAFDDLSKKYVSSEIENKVLRAEIAQLKVMGQENFLQTHASESKHHLPQQSAKATTDARSG